MKKAILLLLLSLATGLLVAPFFLSSEVQTAISVGTNLVSAAASLITLLIAVLLYSRYGVEKSVLTKQTETVFRLFGEMKKTKFTMQHDKVTLFLFLNRLQSKFWEEYKDKELVFGREYMEGLKPIFEIMEDLFLPKEIAEKMNLFKIRCISSVNSADKYMKVGFLGYRSEEKDDMVGVVNNQSVTLGEYVKQWDDVIKISRKWLEKHSGMATRLNFDWC